MNRNTLLHSLLPVLSPLLFLACRESPTAVSLVPSPPDALPADPVVGFWPHPGPTDYLIQGWSRCVSAAGILLNANPLKQNALKEKIQLLHIEGYSHVFWATSRKDSLWEYLAPVLRDSTISRGIEALYVDEPFAWMYDPGVPRSTGMTDNQFLELVVFCHAFGKKLAFSFYQAKPDMNVEQLTHAFNIVKRFDQQHASRMVEDLIIMPDNYFHFNAADLTTSYARICLWASQEHVPRKQIVPWLAPSCMYNGRQAYPCDPERTYQTILEIRSIGFGGWFIYPGAGLPAAHFSRMRDAFKDLGIPVADSCLYDLTF